MPLSAICRASAISSSFFTQFDLTEVLESKTNKYEDSDIPSEIFSMSESPGCISHVSKNAFMTGSDHFNGDLLGHGFIFTVMAHKHPWADELLHCVRTPVSVSFASLYHCVGRRRMLTPTVMQYQHVSAPIGVESARPINTLPRPWRSSHPDRPRPYAGKSPGTASRPSAGGSASGSNGQADARATRSR